jgi:hypothetical protein
MAHIKYNSRLWLNDIDDSHYTGSIVCSDSHDLINRGKHVDRHTFVEISDCYGKIRLHPDLNLGIDDYIFKLKLIQYELQKFVDHLEK